MNVNFKGFTHSSSDEENEKPLNSSINQLADILKRECNLGDANTDLVQTQIKNLKMIAIFRVHPNNFKLNKCYPRRDRKRYD